MAVASNAQNIADCQINGAGMRKSPHASDPNRCTSPSLRWSKTATAIAGTIAAAGHTSSASSVTSAAGIRRTSSGRMNTFTGSANTVMRWK